MLKTLKFFIPPMLIGLGLAFVIIWLSPQLRSNLLNVAPEMTLTRSHMSFSSAVKRAAPAVVNIYSESLSAEPRYMRRQNTIRDLGSGIIMSEQGYILTNYHVINNADQIIVLLNDGRQFTQVQLIGYDILTDLALLKIEADHLPVIPFDEDYTPEVGDVVLAIGNPLNLGQTVTQGIISATGKQNISKSAHTHLLQMDAAINLGNSGGALVNSQGHLVGISSATYASRQNIDIQGISFAVPYSLAKDVMAKLIQHGRVIRGYLGFRGSAVDSQGKDVQDQFTAIAGMRIDNLDPLGPAWQAGLVEGDIVTAIDGQPITHMRQTLELIANTLPGTQLSFRVYRDGKELAIPVVVEELRAEP